MTRNQLFLRPYRPADLPGIYAIEDQCFVGSFRFSRKELKGYIEAESAIALIAETNEDLVGFAVADLQMDGEVTFGYLQTIDVLPVYRGKGIASAMLREVEDRIAEKDGRVLMLHVSVLNRPAIGLYDKHGYSLCGLHGGFYGKGGDAFVYSKTLR